MKQPQRAVEAGKSLTNRQMIGVGACVLGAKQETKAAHREESKDGNILVSKI